MRFFKLIFLLGITLVGFQFHLSQASAQTADRDYVFEDITVDVELFEDSTVEVTEKITYRFDGVFRGVFREVTLENEANLQRCRNNPSLQCGGFEFIEVLELRDNQDRVLNEAKYRVFETFSGGENRLRIEWVFDETGRQFNNQAFHFTIKYKVYGSIGYFNTYDLLYWNAIFPDRDKIVENVEVKLHFPSNINYSADNLSIVGKGFDYVAKYNIQNSTIEIESDNLEPYEDFTILYKFPKGIVEKYATLKLDLSPVSQDITMDGLEVGSRDNQLAGIPPGKHQFLFSASGYESKLVELDLEPGELREIKIELEMSALQKLIIASIIFCNIFGCLLLPLFLLWIYREWSLKGRDIGRRATIIPQYSPPEKIAPYLLGSLKDETVDLVDITATLIDVAYRKYIKIREFEAKTVLGIKLTATDYEFIKLKDFSDLSPVEQKILTGVFGTKDRVTTDDLKYKFYSKIPGIKDAVYSEMVSRGYFSKRPDKVRTGYKIKGGLLLGAGFFLGVFTFFFIITIGLSFSLFIVGIILLFVANSMPAKTQKGSLMLDDILGFRMYMHTAERFRVQDLTPETFERYLSYAIVFGIEEQWAEKFKDIYKNPPEWFESTNTSGWSTITMMRSLTAFNNTATRTLASSPSSSSSSSGGSSWSGGGWSGGGGFSGGFSGGGGGGGGGGAF